jgi:MSHA biogenesis protein MshN
VRVVRRASAAEVAEARYREALAALEGNDPYAAERALRAALSTVSNGRRAAQTLAGLLLQSGRSREASEIALAALAAHPGDPALSRLAARARLAEGDTAGGIRILEAALPAARGDAPLLALLATLYQREAEHGNAIALYEAALRLRPERGAWWTGLAISLEGAGRGGDAADAYRRALASADLGGALQRYADERLAALTPRAGG